MKRYVSGLLCLLFALSSGATVIDIEWSIRECLRGGDATVADIQANLSRTLGWTGYTPSGIAVSGTNASLREYDITALAGELPETVTPTRYFRVMGQGPAPLDLWLTMAADEVLYRRLQEGAYLKLQADTTTAEKQHYKLNFPGKFITARQHTGIAKNTQQKLLPESPEPSTDPALKAEWGLIPVAPEIINGPVPVILIHGTGSNRWRNFHHWATFSPEAEAFRSLFQVWDFQHPSWGINAAIGFDPACPTFEESIVAYLARFLDDAIAEGVTVDGTDYFFPPLPYAMLTHSHGGLKALAFLNNFPDHARNCQVVLSLSGTLTGTPFATPEWLRHTASRYGFGRPTPVEYAVEEVLNTNFFSFKDQGQLDMSWLNHDAAGGQGIPYTHFNAFTWAERVHPRVLSPRDVNTTAAWLLPDFPEDTTFEPDPLLETYCGAMDLVAPRFRGDRYMDRFILYGGYMQPVWSALDIFLESGRGLFSIQQEFLENTGLYLSRQLLDFTAAAHGDFPLGPYMVNDGLVPLQSQLALDGLETARIYETRYLFCWELPALPFAPNMAIINAHTLGTPERIRIFEGWTHLDTVTGRYDKDTMQSDFFIQVAADLLGAFDTE